LQNLLAYVYIAHFTKFWLILHVSRITFHFHNKICHLCPLYLRFYAHRALGVGEACSPGKLLISAVFEMTFPPFLARIRMITSTIETDSITTHNNCFQPYDRCFGLINYQLQLDRAHFQDIYSPDFPIYLNLSLYLNSRL
jgi:hypothetical protein